MKKILLTTIIVLVCANPIAFAKETVHHPANKAVKNPKPAIKSNNSPLHSNHTHRNSVKKPIQTASSKSDSSKNLAHKPMVSHEQTKHIAYNHSARPVQAESHKGSAQPNLELHYEPVSSTKTATAEQKNQARPQTQPVKLVKTAPIVDAAPSQPSQTQVASSGFHWFRWGQTQDSNATANNGGWFSNIQSRTTEFAHKTVANLRYTSYRFGGDHFDPKNGVYLLDCSGYVDNLLHQSSPQAYSTLAQWSGSYKPNSEHYYNFFSRLAINGKGYGLWNAVPNTQKLQPGDVLVFRYKNPHGRGSGGHVMLVMNKTTVNPSVVQVQVADSASAGHSSDTRAPRSSGIGIGTLLLKVNPITGQPYAYAWRIDAPWNDRVNIAMGHPSNA